ncbi:hypothetical protein HPC49_49560 [Pyxidicoccus fallax]|uniref:YEATS domain-containing protein n=1 Tax=Pyxidicoccus fallax TaxID=394095 RepID=A0A848LVK3_9BACT|nr:pYEATS domain-containing protein [Pyxidicoccus fallax]NMO21650.1 hypothetical protein [Pyxidicoccus fallax]NPC86224.1 hypothetical protein [Pyxidicoccus fallax]
MRCLLVILGAMFLLTSPPADAAAGLSTRNTARYLGNDQWEWTVFLEGSDDTLDRIESVEYLLHPTFSPRKRQSRDREDPRGPFALSARGWGTFDIPVTVNFKDGSRTTLMHALSFAPAPFRADESAVRVNNTATRVGENTWRWTAFIEAPEKTLRQIQCVEYRLHETYPAPVQEVCERGDGAHAFPLTMTGWGTFPLRVRVYFKSGSVQELVHPLKF